MYEIAHTKIVQVVYINMRGVESTLEDRIRFQNFISK